jgi:hypothetical protein
MAVMKRDGAEDNIDTSCDEVFGRLISLPKLASQD